MLKFRQLVALMGLLIAALVLCGGPPAWAGEQPYVDMDGDGFDDNDADGDGNGIPDCLAPDYVAPVAEEELAGVFAGVAVDVVLDENQKAVLEESNEDCFGRCSFFTRALTTNRSVFDTDFDSGLGISVTGGACAGGVCQ